MPHINTVLGSIHPDELGACGCHEHVMWGPPGWDYDPEWWFHTPKVLAKCVADLTEYRELGGKSMVCCSGVGLGRDVEFARMLSRYSGVQIIVPTGFWASAGLYNYFIDKDIDFFVDLFVRELTAGIGKSGIRAGHIKVGIGEKMSERDAMLHRAAARASKITGAPVTSHCAWGAFDVIEVMKSEGFDLARLVVSHCSHGEAIDPARDRKIANLGPWISYDSFTVTNTWAVTHYAHPDEKRADVVKELLDAGHKNRMLLSSDNNLFSLGWSRSSPYVGKATPADFLRITPGKLRRVGIPEEMFWEILTENPKRAMAIG